MVGNLKIRKDVVFMSKVTNKNEAIKLIKEGCYISEFSDELCNNKELMLLALQNNPHNIPLVSENLRNDENIVTEAVGFDKYYLKYASERLRNDKSFIKKMFFTCEDSMDIYYLFVYCKEVFSNKEFILELFDEGEDFDFLNTLDYLDDSLLYDEDIINKAVTNKHFDFNYYIGGAENIDSLVEHCQEEYLSFLKYLAIKAVKYHPQVIDIFNELYKEHISFYRALVEASSGDR